MEKGITKKSLLKLNRFDASWRMDTEGYRRFMKHVCHYFDVCKNISELISGKVLYAEIDEEDLVAVCFFFGAFKPDNDTLMLTEYSPPAFEMSWGNSFILRVCVENEENGLHFVPIRMSIK
ncbi:hypothetical protein [uncultured Bacteroides sp.]|uniref:hypothetical protein n=1 Tax=uncultured Bacteroides sp. TaxID=162156 RepID=UPI002AA94BF8|nr:hypothetical protein [uncultured Bacteroides sp.]